MRHVDPSPHCDRRRSVSRTSERIMRAVLVAAALPLLGLPAATAFAQAKDDKVAYVDMARALNDVEDGKSAKAKLKREFDDKQKKLDAMQAELKTKKADFDKQKAMMKPDARAQKQEELQ